jgi:uncharacterized membrane protein
LNKKRPFQLYPGLRVNRSPLFHAMQSIQNDGTTKRKIKTIMTRPKIKIELTATDKAVELTGWLMLLAVWVLTITSYSNLPETIPTHFNGEGKADGFGSRINILALPLVATILFVGIQLLISSHTFSIIRPRSQIIPITA